MEGLLAILVGAFAVAVSPLVPVMRPAAKAAVKGGLALAGVATGAATGAAAVATGAAAAANHQWEQLRSHASTEKTAESGAEMVAAADAKTMEGEPDVEPGSSEAVETAATTVAAQSDEDASMATGTDIDAPAAMEAAAAVPSPTPSDDELATDANNTPAAAAVPSATPSDDELATEANNTPAAVAEARSELLAIDGIGPKVASILAGAGITTFAQVAAADEDQLRAVLAAAGPRYRSMNPSSWPEQASRQLEAE